MKIAAITANVLAIGLAVLATQASTARAAGQDADPDAGARAALASA